MRAPRDRSPKRAPRVRRCLLRVAMAWLTLIAATGCHLNHPHNPDLGVTRDQASSLLEKMRRDPKPLPRPVLVLGGWADPGFATNDLRSHIRSITTKDHPVIGVSFFGVSSYEQAGRRVRRVAAEALNERDRAAAAKSKPARTQPDAPIDVDVVAFSMGGIVARSLARDLTNQPTDRAKRDHASLPIRLRITRLFTISAPHRGAKLARLPSWDPVVSRLNPDGEYIDKLNDGWESIGYELHCYVRLGDGIVGAPNAAPPGVTPRWVETPPLGDGHNGARSDPRILADIARRLRGEAPIFRDPPPPLPEDYRDSD